MHVQARHQAMLLALMFSRQLSFWGIAFVVTILSVMTIAIIGWARENRVAAPKPKADFWLGDCREVVITIAGQPLKVATIESSLYNEGDEEWDYGPDKKLYFRDDKLVGYDNGKGELAVRYHATESRKGFSIGSSLDELLEAQGTPSHVETVTFVHSHNLKLGFSSNADGGYISTYPSAQVSLDAEMKVAKIDFNSGLLKYVHRIV